LIADRPEKKTVQSISTSQLPEITAQRLQSLSFYLITQSLRIWQSYQEVGRSKATKINTAAKIHDMICDAIRLHPDVAQVKELYEMAEQLRQNGLRLDQQLEALAKAQQPARDEKRLPDFLQESGDYGGKS
jgi:HrpA-like RNA helicase